MFLYHDAPNQWNEATGPPSGELEHWLELVHRLPAVRMEKVKAVRHALMFRCYENEQLLDTAIIRLERDMGGACR